MSRATPIRASLDPESSLLPHVRDGIGAVSDGDRSYIDQAIRGEFADSLETDENLRVGREQENRWDYLLGHGASRAIVAFEPHSATNKEVSAVIGKRAKALEQLRPHLAEGAYVRDWFWVASGKVDFVPMEKATNQLNNNGITFVGKQLLAKHLAALAPAKAKKRKKKRKTKKGT